MYALITIRDNQFIQIINSYTSIYLMPMGKTMNLIETVLAYVTIRVSRWMH